MACAVGRYILMKVFSSLSLNGNVEVFKPMDGRIRSFLV